MFGKRDDRTVTRRDDGTYVDRDDAEHVRRGDGTYVDRDEDRGRGEYVRQLTRAVMTLLGAAAAGLLIWLATQVGDDTTGGYWAVYGLLAAAGLTMALSQLLGGWTKWGWPKISAAVFLLGFLPVLIVGGWLLVAHQPDGGSFRSDALNWANDAGIGGLFEDLREYLPVVAFAIGLVFGFTFDTRGPRVRDERVVDRRRRDVEPVPVEERRAADEPLTAERHMVATTRHPDAEPVETRTAPGEPRVPDTDGDRVTTDEPHTVRRTDD
jgi:hypothetical protein